MKRALSIVGWTGVGVGVMYLLDPERGTRRRALMRDKFSRATNLMSEAIGTTGRDLRNSAGGIVASLRSAVSRKTIGDDVVAERVRSKLGFLVRHPSSIDVRVNNGRVILSGLILADEVDGLMKTTEGVRGVKGVESRLEVHQEPGNIPGLQGQLPRRWGREQFEWMQVNWSPTARVLAGLAGGTAAYYGASRRSAPGMALAFVGTGLLVRAATNLELKRLVGIRAGRRAIDFNKTIGLAAPIDHVFRFVTDSQRFPRFMRSVEKVEDNGERRSRWTLRLPGGFRFHWNAVITRLIPNTELSWRTEPDSLVQHTGIIKFTESPTGCTTLYLRMSYNPPGGALGHALASTVGLDSKALLDEELMRLKSVIETGVLPSDVRERKVDTGERLTRA
jgi:uncharacterized membrane protein